MTGIGGERMQPSQIERKIFNEIGKLADDDGQRQDHHDCNRENGKEHDGECRQQPVHSQPLHPAGKGIEQISEHHTRHERKKDLAQ